MRWLAGGRVANIHVCVCVCACVRVCVCRRQQKQKRNAQRALNTLQPPVRRGSRQGGGHYQSEEYDDAGGDVIDPHVSTCIAQHRTHDTSSTHSGADGEVTCKTTCVCVCMCVCVCVCLIQRVEDNEPHHELFNTPAQHAAAGGHAHGRASRAPWDTGLPPPGHFSSGAAGLPFAGMHTPAGAAFGYQGGGVLGKGGGNAEINPVAVSTHTRARARALQHCCSLTPLSVCMP